METGVSYNQQRLHKVGYFRELLAGNEEVHPSIRPLLKLSRETIVRLQKMDYALVSSLQRDPLLAWIPTLICLTNFFACFAPGRIGYSRVHMLDIDST